MGSAKFDGNSHPSNHRPSPMPSSSPYSVSRSHPSSPARETSNSLQSSPTRANGPEATTISPYHGSKVYEVMNLSSSRKPRGSMLEGVPFLLKWHKEGADCEVLSLSAPSGLFRPFEDECFLDHLQLKSHASIQHLDVGTGTWVTVFKSSPPVIIKSGGTYHFKEVGKDVPISNVIDNPAIKTSMRLFKSESWDSDRFANDLSGKPFPSSPSTSLANLEPWDGNTVGTRPCRLSVFPGKTANEARIRLKWIAANTHLGSLRKRFEAVYLCPFHSSTYHRHQNAWRWLESQGRFGNQTGSNAAIENKSWKDLAQEAWRHLNEVEVVKDLQDTDAETINLTLEDH